MVWMGLRFEGVISLVAESDIRANWVSDIEAASTDDVVGLFIFWECSTRRAVVIMSMAFQSSSLSSVRPWFRMVAWVVHC